MLSEKEDIILNKISILAHELHDPNIIVRGSLTIALELAKEVRNALNDISSCKKLNTIIENLHLAIQSSMLFSSIIENVLSSVRKESITLHIKNINIVSLLIYLINIFQEPAENKYIILNSIEIDHLNVHHIYGDNSLLMRAFINVYHNAIKYSYFGKSGLKQRIIRTICHNISQFFRIEIENYGVGILKQEIDKVWEEGYRGILASDTHRSGSGLGLSQVMKIISAHNGKVRIDSNPITKDIMSGPYLTRVVIDLPYVQPE